MEIDCDVSVGAMRHFAAFTSLTALTVYSNTAQNTHALSDGHMCALTSLTSLRKLRIHMTDSRLTEASFETFSRMPSLSDLGLIKCDGILSLQGIEHCTNLRQFRFYPSTDGYCMTVNNNNGNADGNNIARHLRTDDARAISRLSSLRVLKLTVSPDCVGMYHLSTMPSLCKLAIRSDAYDSPRTYVDISLLLPLLIGFPNLEEAAVGEVEGGDDDTIKELCSRIRKHRRIRLAVEEWPSLRAAWQ